MFSHPALVSTHWFFFFFSLYSSEEIRNSLRRRNEGIEWEKSGDVRKKNILIERESSIATRAHQYREFEQQ